MPTFKVTYQDARGRSRSLKVQAADALTAKRTLRRRGIASTNIERQAQSRESGKTDRQQHSPPRNSNARFNPSFLERTPSTSDKAVFANKLAALVDAGVPIVRGIDLMAAQQRGGLFKRALLGVAEDLRQGQTLASAMRRWPKVFDRLTIPMVEAGEAGGVLDETLRRLAKLLEDTAKLKAKLKGAMIYPTAVFVIAILVFLGMTIFIVPVFADIFESLGSELPWFTQLFVDLSALLRSTFSLILLIILILGLWLFGMFYATPSGRRVVDRFILKLPLFGDLALKVSTAQFCRTFSALTRAGVPILLSLEIVKDTASNSIVSDCIKESREDVLQGVPLSIALQRKNIFPMMAVAMLSIGEETGEVDKMLSKVGDFYEEEVENLVKALTSLLEPLMIIIVGVIVGAILLALYLPMFTVFEKFLQS